MKIREHPVSELALAVLVVAPVSVSAQPEPWFHPDGTMEPQR